MNAGWSGRPNVADAVRCAISVTTINDSNGRITSQFRIRLRK